jgi:hypothetical protein
METLVVGYIRTATYRKVLGLLKAERITRFIARRALQKQTHKEEVEFLTCIRTTDTRYSIDWSRGTQGAFPVKVLYRLLNERKVTEMLVQSAEVMVESPEAVVLLNQDLEQRFQQKHTPTSQRQYLDPKDHLLLTFVNNPANEAVSLEYVQDLNAEARKILSSPIGVMDLKSMRTERALAYGEKEEWDLNDPRLVRILLKTLDRSGWPETERFVTTGGIRHVASPTAIRTYRKTSGERWQLAENEEVGNGGN